MLIRSIALAAPLALGLSGAALAQTAAPSAPGAPASNGTVVTPQTNSTGSSGAVTVTPNGNPAESRSNDSSAAGNAGQPERAAPQGSGSAK